MDAALIMAIIFGGSVLVLAIIGSTILMAINYQHGGVLK
jgi:hypothetical protein